MAVTNPKYLKDRFAIAAGGHNSGDDPEWIGATQYAGSRNVTMRGGRVQSRPRFRKRAELPTDPGNGVYFQGMHFFKGTGQMVMRAGGKLFVLEPNALGFVEVGGFQSNPYKEQVWFEEVGGLLVMQDGQQTPSRFDGAGVAFAEGVPVGTAMRFANGRLHLARAGNRRNLEVGDILQEGDPETALRFTESGYLLGGGSFAFPDPITALHEIPIMDTGSGQGSMVVGTTRNVYSLRTEIVNRDLWSGVDGFVRPLLPGIGVAGPRSVAAVNNDLYFRSTRGLRSLRMAVGEQQSPGYGGLQQEIPEKFYDWGLGQNSTIHAGDRLLTLVHPRIEGHRWVYEGAVVINFESINRLGEKSPLAFDGYWDLPEGHGFRQLLEVDGKAFAVVLTPSGDELWELQGEGNEFFGESPEQEFVTRAMNGGDFGGLKVFRRLDLWMGGIRSDVELDIYVRADRKRDWVHWLGYGEDGNPLEHTLEVTRTVGGGYNPKLPEDAVSRLTLPSPPERLAGYSFQVKVAWRGRCRIDLLQAYFQPIAESEFAVTSTPIELT